MNWGELVGVYKLDLSRLVGAAGWEVGRFGEHGRVIREEIPGLDGIL